MHGCTDGAAAVETLRGELAQAKEQAGVNQAAADKEAVDLTAEQAARRRFEERVTEMEQKLKDTAAKCESLETENKAKGIDVAKALQYASPGVRNPISRHRLHDTIVREVARFQDSATEAVGVLKEAPPLSGQDGDVKIVHVQKTQPSHCFWSRQSLLA